MTESIREKTEGGTNSKSYLTQSFMHSRKHCPLCGRGMQAWGKTKAGTIRFFCPSCHKTATWKRKDVVTRHIKHELEGWLLGKETLKEMGSRLNRTRQTLWREFRPLLHIAPEKIATPEAQVHTLILDGTYVHGHTLCALIAIDENDNLFWKFAPYESYKNWLEFLSHFSRPKVLVMDGQKGLFAAARKLWPNIPIQRCQFHVVAFITQYIGRRPKDGPARDLLNILYKLKEARTPELRDRWLELYRDWEDKHEKMLALKNIAGGFKYSKLRSARLIVRRALPNIFTYLDFPMTPNTTNLVEGWVNTALAEALHRHRGLREHEKKALTSIILSHLARANKKAKPLIYQKTPDWAFNEDSATGEKRINLAEVELRKVIWRESPADALRKHYLPYQ